MFHQFGVVTGVNGTLLAFAEGRFAKGDSSNPHHICEKRSTDGGRTWGETIIVADATKDICMVGENETNGKTGHCYCNPTAVVDDHTGRIFLFYADNYENESSKLYCVHSDDDGLNWSEPDELTQLFMDDPLSRPFHLPGPGHGIQLRAVRWAGRLLVTVWHRLSITLAPDAREYGLSCLYSDDGGKTWRNSEYLAQRNHLNEGRPAELPDGMLLINARGIDNHRYRATSVDGGIVWSDSLPWGSIGEYDSCDSGFYSELQDGYTRLLTSHLEPGATKRNSLCLRLSYDAGKTWAYGGELWYEPELEIGTGASDIAAVADGVYGVIHGTSWDGKQEVQFIRVELGELIGTDDETQVKHTHLGGIATCELPAICAICAAPYEEALGHRFVNFTCKRCGALNVRLLFGLLGIVALIVSAILVMTRGRTRHSKAHWGR